MLAAGLFEYNFGDSEFLMLFLLLVTLPFAAARPRRPTRTHDASPAGPRRARDLVARFTGRHVLVVGDVMLDRFIVGDVTRISPEAPVPVVRFQSEYLRLGGAANVAHNLAALGARVSLVGVVGTDAAARRLREQLTRRGHRRRRAGRGRGRPTVEKVRIVTGRNQQVARIDYEETAT